MTIHESNVNYRNLIRDLAEMYPFEVSEVIVVELVANSLDAGATQIAIDYDPSNKSLVVSDNGKGMTAQEFEEYHDFAAGLKKRGTGIGFAGVGAKISFNVAERVMTQTRGRSFSGGSNWYLQSRKKLVWEDIKPSHVSDHGTRIEVKFGAETNPSYSTSADLIELLKRHYLPLFDRDFLNLYKRLGFYSNSLRFVVNGQTVLPGDIIGELGLQKVRKLFPSRAGKKIGYGLFGLAAQDYPIGYDRVGVLLCTHGKAIKPELFNQFPGDLGPRIFGLVEIPNFIDFLTTSKTDLLHPRGKHREFEGLYDPIRQEFKAWLTELGVQSMEILDTQEAKKLEKELMKLLDDIPELSEFFGFRSKKHVLGESQRGTVDAAEHQGVEITFPIGRGLGRGSVSPLDIGNDPGNALVTDPATGTKKAQPISRTARRGPKIVFVTAPDRIDLAWVDGNNVVVNSGHPSYSKVRSNTPARRILSLFAIGNAVMRFLSQSDSPPDSLFVDRLMAAWGNK
jgi:hypothetical protein